MIGLLKDLVDFAVGVNWAKLPWKWIGVGAGALALISLMLWARGHYINQGVREERDRWIVAGQHAEAHIRDAVQIHTVEHVRTVTRIVHALDAGREQLEAVSHATDEAFLSAWSAADRSLLDAAAGSAA